MKSLVRCDVVRYSLNLDTPDQGLEHICIDASDSSVLSISKSKDNDNLLVHRNGSLLDIVEQLPPEAKSIVSVKHLAESDNICVCFHSGDILLIPATAPSQAEVVGAIEHGIKAVEWSPDEELLVLINGEDKLLLLTKDFDVLSEGPMRTSDFGQDKPVNVGWGHADTQFRGSIGKLAGRTTNETQQYDALDPAKDDFSPRISWRGDSAHFAISCVDPALPSTSTEGYRRVIRFYSRTAILQATSELSPGMEHALAWQPSGSIIASTMRTTLDPSGAGSKRDVIFFERNGLRRYDFPLRQGATDAQATVKSLMWNADSSILAVYVVGTQGHSVQLWTRNNYHWYLKQEILSASPDEPFVSVCWHPEKALYLYIGSTNAISSYCFQWQVLRSSRPPPHESGLVAVVDGSDMLITPFRYQNVPPPMSAYRLSRPERQGAVPVHATFSSDDDIMALLYADLSIDLWQFEQQSQPAFVKSVDLSSAFPSGSHVEPYQFALNGTCAKDDLTVAVLGCEFDAAANTSSSYVWLVHGLQGATSSLLTLPAEERPLSVVSTRSAFYASTASPGLVLKRTMEDPERPEPLLVSETYSDMTVCPARTEDEEDLLIGLTQTGRLSVNEKTIDTESTSFVVCGDFLVYSTTMSHQARFVLLSALQPAVVSSLNLNTCPTRRLERGSRIVTGVASTMTLVLQMPRGNLEIICPRPLVLQAVCADLEKQSFKRAFMHCRKHRIDLNILHDYDPQMFIENLQSFVDQLDDVDHLNLFISSLKNEDVRSAQAGMSSVTPYEKYFFSDKVNQLCSALRSVLEQKDLTTYLNSILTTHVCQQPADYESALQVISQLKTTNEELCNEAVKYIIFLSDANKLFDVALGLYDFNLVIMVAQHSQKDPKEYIAFLRELKALEPHLQRFRIDDHLQRRSKALASLVQAGPKHFEEVKSYISQHELYEDALQLYSDDVKSLRVIHELFGDHLYSRNRYSHAALGYTLAGNRKKAIDAHVNACDWQECFTLALSSTQQEEPYDADQIAELAASLAQRLKGASRFSEAARVLLDYGQDVEASISASCEGSDFKEAIRNANLYARQELIQSMIAPAISDSVDNAHESIEELRDQIRKQVGRLGELAKLKARDPEAYYGEVDYTALEGVDVDDSASTVAGTAFTRYTKATTNLTRTTSGTGTTAKARRKDARKKAAGDKKGTVWEEDYLLGSISRSVETRLAQLQKEVRDVLPPLLTIGNNSKPVVERARILQTRLRTLENEINMAIDKVWDANRLEELAKKDVVAMIKRPTLPKDNWSLAML